MASPSGSPTGARSTTPGSPGDGRGAAGFAKSAALQGSDDATVMVRTSMGLLDELGVDTVRSLDTVAAAQQSIAQAKAHDALLRDADAFQDREIGALTLELNHLRRECADIKRSMKQEKLLRATELTAAIAHEIEHMEALRKERFDIEAALLNLETERFILTQEALLLDPSLRKKGGALFQTGGRSQASLRKTGTSSRRSRSRASPTTASTGLLKPPGSSVSFNSGMLQLMPPASSASANSGSDSHPSSPLGASNSFGVSDTESPMFGSPTLSPKAFVGRRGSTPGDSSTMAAAVEAERTSALTRDGVFGALIRMDDTSGAAAATRRADTQKPKPTATASPAPGTSHAEKPATVQPSATNASAQRRRKSPSPERDAGGGSGRETPPRPSGFDPNATSGGHSTTAPSPYMPPSASAAAVRLQTYLDQTKNVVEADARQLRALRAYAEELASGSHRRAPHRLRHPPHPDAQPVVARSATSMELRQPTGASFKAKADRAATPVF